MCEWRWSHKVGECVMENYGKEFTINLYQGNALLIFIHEYVEDEKEKYNLIGLWVDENQMKVTLGLRKNSQGEKYNYYDNDSFRTKKLTFYKKAFRKGDLKKILAAISDAEFETPIQIEILNKGFGGGEE